MIYIVYEVSEDLMFLLNVNENGLHPRNGAFDNVND